MEEKGSKIRRKREKEKQKEQERERKIKDSINFDVGYVMQLILGN